MKRKQTKNVLTVWSPHHCPIDTGGDHIDLHVAAKIAIQIAIERKTTATVILDHVEIAADGTETRKLAGEKILEVDGNKILKSGLVRGFYTTKKETKTAQDQDPVKWGIWCRRSSVSVCGPAAAWMKSSTIVGDNRESKVLLYDDEQAATDAANKLNRDRSSTNVWYKAKQYDQ